MQVVVGRILLYSGMVLFHGETVRKLTPRQRAYREFLDTPQWLALRRRCYELADWTCARCKCQGRELHAHHRSCPERWEDTTQDHLECLCYECHGSHHGNGALRASRQERIGGYETLLDANMARQAGLLSKAQYRDLRRAFRERGDMLKKFKKKPKRYRVGKMLAKAKAKHAYWKNSIMGFRNHRPRWRNRDNSSN